ncbi:hypothetical protein PHLCEN_2v13488 [Hermanssonia centrifuga]|uniref:Uncharacterized protein n=1 Tax=Hermanssonia centrifuga TaxID=98765 RepID=A0A2R6NEF7_9APHY|nr:hypothetical protein PHLCEN_2v13488 [Hermanssonia centrifuga]
MSPRPRPILKRTKTPSSSAAQGRGQVTYALPFATCKAVHSPHVHFPPTPSIVASTHPAHSPRTYDRKPILVSPNECGLADRKLYSPPADFEVERPERERGRSRRNSTDKDENLSVKGSYFHPRAFEACEPEPFLDDHDEDEDTDTSSSLSPPLLVQDLSTSDDSSSSEDSDDVTTPPDSKLASVTPAKALLPLPFSSHNPFSVTSSLYGTRQVPGSIKLLDGPSMQRPFLKRADKGSSLDLTNGFWATLDEGCLGGF